MKVAVASSDTHPVGVVIGVFVWLGAIVWIFVAGFLDRQAAEAIFRETPEYQCIAAASSEPPKFGSGYLKNLGGANTGFHVGKLVEEPGANCIEDGDAISFALLPEGPGDELSIVRIKGLRVMPDFRRDMKWADITDETGEHRWRNDGDGYRKISP
jgi:hypothetical protein